jgi:putative PEP-CTERM system TPR-repeat lipoprotein
MIQFLLFSRRAVLLLAVTLALAGCAKDDPSAFIASAKSYMAKANYKAAIIELKNAIQGGLDNGEARFLLAKSLFENGEPGAAETEVRKAIDLKYSPDDVYPLLARALLAQGRFDLIVKELAPIKPGTAEGRTDLATSISQASLALGDAKAATAAIDAALAETPRNARALVVKAQILAQGNDIAGAQKAIDAALTHAPNDQDAMFARAQLLAGIGKRSEAIAALEQTIVAHPQAKRARMTLISMLVSSQQVDAAKAHLEKLKQQAPNEFGTVYSDALVSFAQGDTAHARDQIQKVLVAQPEHLPSLYLSGLINLQLKSYASAEQALRKVLSMAPGDVATRKVLGITYLRSGQPTLAREILEPALQRSPDDPDLLRATAETLLATGNVARGAQLYERANSIDKNNLASKVRLAQVRMATGETERAFNDLEALSQAETTQSQADLALIMAHVQRKEFDKALAAADTLQKKQPNSQIVYNVRGSIYLAKRDLKNARASFEKGLELKPDDFAAAHSLALLDVQEGKADNARKRFEQMLVKNPKSEPLLLALAELTALTRENPEETRAIIDKAIEANPASVRPRLALIAFFVRQRDARAALNAAEAAQSALPDDAQILDALATAQLASGDTNQAIATLNRLAQRQSPAPAVLTRIAAIQFANKDYPGAIESARKALAAQPDLPQAWAMLARAQVLNGQTEAAIAEARKLQKEHPKRAFGYALEGEILAANKKWVDTAATLRLGLAKQPIPHLARGVYLAYRQANKPADATAFAESWIRDHPRDTTLQELMAQELLAKKDYPAAIAKYRAVLDKNPENAVALNNMAWLLGETGDSKAQEYAERAFRQAPFSPEVVDTLGWTLFQTGDAARGTQLLRLASNLAPDNNEIRLHLGQALQKSGDKDGARRVLEPLTKLAEGTPARVEAEKALAGK